MPLVISYTDAPEVRAVAKDLIAAHHGHLKLDRIIFLFTEKTPSTGGKDVLGKARLVSELEAAAFGDWSDYAETADFIIVVTRSWWAILDDAKREALVDHELCHCYYDDAGMPRIAVHDVQEFNEVVRRHGLWSTDLEKMAHAVQPHLPFGGDAGGTTVTITAGGESVTTTPAKLEELNRRLGEVAGAGA